MKKYPALFIFFLLTCALYAQQTGAYLIPRQIFVGDPAVLVLPLPATIQNSADVVLTRSDSLPFESFFLSNENIDINKITLEKRTTGSRLIIEFTAFSTGILEFPVIEIGGEYFSGLTVSVNSLIDKNQPPVLSGTASALAIPGTMFMLYGSLAVFILFILLLVWFFIKGRTMLSELQKKWKRYRLFASMKKTERQLFKAVIKKADKRIILDKLSDEFRNFLSVLTGTNCRSMTARELELLPPLMQENCPISLGSFFRFCDELRFSGENIDPHDILKLLDDLKIFIHLLEGAKEKDRKGREKA